MDTKIRWIRGMQEIKEGFYMRYLKLKLELATLEQEIEVYKKKYDRELYSGMHNVSAIDYTKVSIPKQTKEINEFYQDFINLGKEIRKKEEYLTAIKVAVNKMEADFKEYAEKFNDLEMKIFIEMYIYKKPLVQVALFKNDGQRYSYRQVRRLHNNLKKKFENF